MLACGILNGFFVFIWGQRSALVIVGALLVLATVGTRPEHGPRRRASGLRTVGTLVMIVLIVIGVSSGLRVARDTLVAGEVQDVVADATIWRQMSLATNSIYFDSSMLAFRDWPDQHPYHLGEDFALSAGGFVPRIVWAGKPKTVVAGRWFRQVYQPGIVNGWPIGAPTLWWINFGPLGILIGGLITGLVFGAIRRMQLNSARSSLNIAVALITAVYVFQTGVGPEWPVYFMSWLAPLWVLVAIVTHQPKKAEAEPEPEPEPVTTSTP
jgi:hypothetical protein